MSNSSLQRKFRWPKRRSIYLGVISVLTLVLAVGAMLIPQNFGAGVLPLTEGDVAPQDILAPIPLTYESPIQTEALRQAAAQAVAPVYLNPDANIARTQVDLLRASLTYIELVRMDQFDSREQKLTNLASMQHINLNRASAEAILDLNDSSWNNVSQEAISVLEQVMRTPIREDLLEEARSSIPNLVSLSLPEEHAALVIELVSAHIAPNSLYSADATEEARQEARDAIATVTVSYKANETVVGRGAVITAADLEALEKLGLVQPQLRWQEVVSVSALAGAGLLLTAMFVRSRPELLNDSLALSIIAAMFLVFLFSARLIIPGRTVIPYLFPLAGFSLIVTALFSSQAAIIISIPLSLLAAYGLPNAFDLSVYFLIGCIFGAYIMKRAQRIATYFGAGAAVAAAGMLVILAYRLPDNSTDLLGLATLIGTSALNGLASASITIIVQFFLAPPLGLTTALQLHEISRPDHPLLQFILRTAPGTYQHSLQIANLSEQAAELIGANALLTRVGSLYHDAGKARFPHYFIENQIPGSPNPHEELKPEESAQVIIRHVADGLDLAKKHGLPRRIRDFIAEHHGTTITRYQFAQMLESVGGDRSKVDIRQFTYPGPRPQSRETALVMLADGCEARTRAERPKTREEVEALVKDVFDKRIANGQLDNTGLTLRDLKMVADSFITTLRGIYHPRVLYPDFDQDTEPFEGTPEAMQDHLEAVRSQMASEAEQKK